MKRNNGILYIAVLVCCLFWGATAFSESVSAGLPFIEKLFFDVALPELVFRILCVIFIMTSAFIIKYVLYKKEYTIHETEKLKNILNNTLYSIGDAVIATDRNGAITHINSVAEEITEFSFNEAIGKNINEVFKIKSEDPNIKVSNPFETIMQSGTTVGLANHTILISKTGREYYISDCGSPIKDEADGISGAVLVFRNVNKERATQIELNNSEERFRSIVAHSNEGVALIDENALVIEWNETLEEISGLSRVECIDKPIRDVLKKIYANQKRGEETAALSYLQIRKALDTGASDWLNKIIEVEYVDRGGITKYISQIAYAIPRNNGYWIAINVNDLTDQKLSHLQIEKTQEKFLKIFQMSPVAIFISRLKDSIILDANNSFEEITHYKKHAVIGSSANDFGFWAVQDDRVQYLKSLLDYGEVKNFVAKLKFADSKVAVCAVSGILISLDNENCEITYFYDVSEQLKEEERIKEIQDELESKIKERTIELEQINDNLMEEITDRIKAENALRESEEKHRSMINQLPVGVYRTSSDGKFIQANPALAKILGYDSINELIETNVYDFYHNIEHRLELLEKQKSSEKLVKEELKFKRKDGRTIWVRDNGKATLNEDGTILCTDGVIEDITEQKLAEKALLQSEAKYRLLFKNLHDIFFRVSKHGEILEISPSVKTTLGYEINELLNKSIRVLTSDLNSDEDLIEIVKDINSTKNIIIPVKNKVNNIVYLSINIHPYYDRDTKKTGMEGIARDISQEIKHQIFITSLYDISRAISTTESEMELFKSIHNSLSKIIDATNFFIALVNETETAIEFPYFVDTHDEWIKEIPINTPGSYTSQVVKSGKPLLRKLGDIQSEVQDNNNTQTGTYSLQWLGVPLKLKNKVIGAIVVQSYVNPNLYNDDDVSLLQSVSDQIAIAIGRKRSLIALHNQYLFMQKLIDTIPNPIYYKEVNSLFYIGCNRAFEEFFEVKAGEIIGKTSEDIFSAERAATYRNYDSIIIQDKQTQIYEDDFINDDGFTINTVVYKSMYYDANENPAGIVGIILDITERKKAESEIREAREYAELLYKVTPSSIFTLDNQKRITSWNERIAQLTGYTADEVIGKECKLCLNHGDNDCLLFDYDADKPIFSYETELITKDGMIKSISKNIDLLRDLNGNVIGGIESFEDITDRKNMEIQLYQQVSINSAIADLSKAIISSATLNDITKLVLEHSKKLTKSPYGFVGYIDAKNKSLVIPAISEEIIRDKFKKRKAIETYELNSFWGWTLKNKKSIISNNAFNDPRYDHNKEDKVIPEKVLLAPAMIGSTLIGIVALMNAQDDYIDADLQLVERMASLFAVATQRIHAETETRLALEKEQELNELKSSFISMVSHEYRTPLQAIVLSTELLRDYGDKLGIESRDKHFDRIQKSVKTMNSLLDDILTLNKTELGKLSYSPDYLDIDNFVTSLTNEMQFVAKDKCKILLTINKSGIIASLDEKLLQQVLTNLLTNAIKYSKQGGRIEFIADVKETEVIFIVRDHGIGIPEEDQPKLFQPFFRSKNVGTISGTGLGLAIVKETVGIQNGTIEFESKENDGTTFYVKVPFNNGLSMNKTMMKTNSDD